MLSTLLLPLIWLVSPLGEAGALAPSSRSQRILASNFLSEDAMVPNSFSQDRPKIPGDNDAYFCGPPPSEQIALIEELTVSPWPVLAGHHFFIYASLLIPEDTPGVSETVIELRGTLSSDDGTEHWNRTDPVRPFAGFLLAIVRYDWRGNHGRELRVGRNEIVIDDSIWSEWTKAGNYTVEAELRLPDSRTLACAKTALHLDGSA